MVNLVKLRKSPAAVWWGETSTGILIFCTYLAPLVSHLQLLHMTIWRNVAAYLQDIKLIHYIASGSFGEEQLWLHEFGSRSFIQIQKRLLRVSLYCSYNVGLGYHSFFALLQVHRLFHFGALLRICLDYSLLGQLSWHIDIVNISSMVLMLVVVDLLLPLLICDFQVIRPILLCRTLPPAWKSPVQLSFLSFSFGETDNFFLCLV